MKMSYTEKAVDLQGTIFLPSFLCFSILKVFMQYRDMEQDKVQEREGQWMVWKESWKILEDLHTRRSVNLRDRTKMDTSKNH